MRKLVLLLLALAVPSPGGARAQDVVQEFSGTGETTTGMFTVGDRWEVRWNARQAISVAAMSSNGTIVAGASGVLRGSLFVPAGGQYYLKVTDGTVAPSAPATTNAPPAAPTNAAPATNTTNAPSADTNAAPVTATNAAPEVIPEPAPILPDVDTPSAPPVSWHLQVVQMPAEVASTNTLTVYTPYFTVPDSAITPVTPPPAPPTPTLTPDQMRVMVSIKGDNAQGNGFLVHRADGVFVACHLHLLVANPNPQITSCTGESIKILSVKAATDRDLALIAVQDDHLNALPVPAKDDSSATPGDDVLIPVVGEPDALGGKAGKIVSFDTGRVDFDDALDANSMGAPVIAVKGGAALAIVTAEKRIDLTEDIAKAWAGNPAPGSAAIIPYFGVMLKDVAGWETIDLAQFTAENQFLKSFHETTRCLDSYLNARRHYSGNGNPPDIHYYAKNAQIVAAVAAYKKFTSLDAARELLFDLQSVADADVSQLQSSTPSCAFSRQRVQEELAYRKAIRAELDSFVDNIKRLDEIAQRTR